MKEDVLLITLSERRGHGIPQRATGGSTKVGQKVKTPEAEFTIEEIAKMRITRVKIQLIHEPENIHEDIQEEYPDDVK